MCALSLALNLSDAARRKKFIETLVNLFLKLELNLHRSNVLKFVEY